MKSLEYDVYHITDKMKDKMREQRPEVSSIKTATCKLIGSD